VSRDEEASGAPARTAEELRRSEERYRLASLATNDAIWDWDLREDVLAWNDAVERLFGHRREALGTSISGWYDQIHPDDRERVVRGRHAVIDAGESRWQDEYRFRRSDGTWALVADRGFIAQDAQGRPIRMVGAMQDLTEQRRAQSERDRFFTLAADPMCLAGDDGHLKRVNPAFARTLGYSAEELLRVPFVSFLHPDDVAPTVAAMETLVGGDALVQFENRWRHRDGSYRWLSWSSSPDPDARVVYAAARDVTDQKRLAAEARERERFEQQLIGIVSHDLRSPITTIVLDASTLARRERDAPSARSIARILGAAERALRLIRDLLDFTQARHAGGLPVRRGPLDLHDLARRIVDDELQPSHPGRRFELRRSGDGRGAWDADRLAQVVTNLATNAATYGAADAPVTVTTRGEPDAVVLEVHNSGEPIAAVDRARLFEPLQRGTRDVGHGARSVGLGLYIVKSIVGAHGGTVQVTSSAAAGTTFTVRLPRAGGPAAEPAGAARAGGGKVLEAAALPRVELSFQNDDHVEEARLLNALGELVTAHRAGSARAEEVRAAFGALLAHTRDHFERENAAMREAGFPVYPVHSGEHARVLAEMEEEARAFAATGDVERLWAYVSSAVPSWFVKHIHTMDAATGAFIAGRAR
jgi:PAS domain S-box-containing protein/hemerythrin-like metal-binding protein